MNTGDLRTRRNTIHLDSPRRWVGTWGYCCYQGFGSTQSSGKGEKYTLDSFVGHHNCQLKKDAQYESFKLSFIWSKMRIAVWGTISQTALRNCSKEIVGGDQYMSFL